MKVFGKRFGAALLFGSMMFTTVNCTSVYAVDDSAVAGEQVDEGD